MTTLSIAVGDSVTVNKPMPALGVEVKPRHLTASLSVGDDVGEVVTPPAEVELPLGDCAVWFPERGILLSLPADSLTKVS